MFLSTARVMLLLLLFVNVVPVAAATAAPLEVQSNATSRRVDGPRYTDEPRKENITAPTKEVTPMGGYHAPHEHGEATPLALHSSALPEDLWRLSSSRVTRRLAVISVSSGVGTLQAAVNAAAPGDVLVLADGIYTVSSGSEVLKIDGTTPTGLTIRAANPGMVVIDAQGVSGWRGVTITGGSVTIEDVEITGGNTVRSPCPKPCPATPLQYPSTPLESDISFRFESLAH